MSVHRRNLSPLEDGIHHRGESMKPTSSIEFLEEITLNLNPRLNLVEIENDKLFYEERSTEKRKASSYSIKKSSVANA